MKAELQQIREALEFARPFVSGYGWHNHGGPSERHLPILDAALAMCDKLDASKTDEQLYAEAMASVTPDALDRMDRKVKAIDEMDAQPPAKVITQMRDEMELLGAMIRAERSNPSAESQQCTDEQLERCYALRDKLEASKTDEQLYAEAMASVTPDALARMDRKVKALDAMEAQPPAKVDVEDMEDIMEVFDALVKDWIKNDGEVTFQDFTIPLYAHPQPPVKVDVWIPVTERLPLENDRVLATDGTDVIEVRYGHYGTDKRTTLNFRSSRTGPVLDDVTHWMSLPQPPKS